MFRKRCGKVGLLVLAGLLALPLGLIVKSSVSEKGEIGWADDLHSATRVAGQEDKRIFVKFYADWCAACKSMSQTTLRDKDVVKRLRDFVAVKINVDKNVDLARQYGIMLLPTVMILDAKGAPEYTRSGYIGATDLLHFLDFSEKAESSEDVKL